MEFAWAENQVSYREELREVLATLPDDWWSDYAPSGPSSPKVMEHARIFNARLAERNLIVRHWPREYGGMDASAWQQIIISEEMWSVGEPRSSLYLGANWAGPAIMRFGTEAQKQKWLRAIADGRLLWCQGFSEPEAGTDLGNMRTCAEPIEGGYRINGSKIWTSYAARADVIFLLARVGGKGKGGVSCFIVPTNTPGIEMRPIAGVHSKFDFHEVFFTDADVPHDALLGEEGNGWQIVQTIIHYERIGAGRYEKAARGLDHIVAKLRERGQFDDPVVQADCASALAAVEAARLQTYLVIDGRAKGKDAGAETYLARWSMIQADHAVANLASTYLPDLLLDGVDGHVRTQFNSAITAGIAAGAAEVQLNMISGRYLGLPRGA